MSEVKVDTISERTAAGGVTIDGVLIKDGVATFQTAAGSPLVFEGATADAFETTFAITDPTADRTITFPDADVTLGSVKVAYLVDEQTSGTNGGTFTNGAWRHRDLNTEYYDTIGVTLSSNEFTLPVGTFYIDWTCPAIVVNQHRSRLYNTTSTTVVKYGTSAYSNPVHDWGYYADAEVSTTSCGSAAVTLTSTATFKVEHRCVTTVATYGFGKASSLAEEIYTTVKIMQIA